jgi:acetyltransferase-like isoleucine patch superfamily enzyme
MGCYLDGRAGIRFGENVWVGPRVIVVSKNHDLNHYECYVDSGPVFIGRDSWLGANCIVLPGVVMGPHTVVAAGAVVTASFPEGNQVLAGCPARVVKKLPDYGVKA